MSSATENYGRLKLLSERLVHPAAENVLETYLRSEKVTIHRFLETHKHHIMHCYRSKTSCCSTQANCNFPRAQPLSKRQWNLLYTEEQSNSCTKPDCVCNVVTTCKKFRKLNISVIFFLLTEFSMVDGLKMAAVKRLEKELLTLPEHLSLSLVFSGVRVTRSLVLCVCFVDRCLSFCTFSFGHCVVCSSIYGL
jgi:hypothetical protein